MANRTNPQFENLGIKIDGVDKDVRDLGKSVNKDVSRLGGRIGGVSKRIDGVAEDVRDLTGDVRVLTGDVGEIKGKLDVWGPQAERSSEDARPESEADLLAVD